jgi:FlaA1/EpsC-like NDP-sugar epimerase
MTEWLFSLRNRDFFLLDLVLLAASPTIALAVRLEGSDLIPTYALSLAVFTAIALLIKVPIFWRAGLYVRYWRYASVDELAQIVLATLVASAALMLAYYAFLAPIPGLAPSLPRSVGAIDALLCLAFAGGPRFALRWAESYLHRLPRGKDQRRIVVIGAGDAGRMIVREMQANPHLGMAPIAFLDDDPHKQNLQIQRIPVLGLPQSIAEVAATYRVSQAIIAMPTAPGNVIRQIVTLCEEAGLAVRTVPGVYEILGEQVTVNQIRNVQIEDLLRREPVRIDSEAVRALVNGRRVLVTGAGGSIGSELCRQVARYGPSEIVFLGHGEDSIFRLGSEFARSFPGVHTARVIADARNAGRLEAVFRRWRPQLVFHAAAHKHVPLMEENPAEAVTNNVGGTLNMVEAAVAHGVERFVLISTDKAVKPASIMGVTKRVAELVVMQSAQTPGRRFPVFNVVRFGNVLGSRGSVVNLFREQIACGGPVTVTHPDMRRFFMTIPEAVQLVLQAATLGTGGETFVLDMGEQVRILDMARELIELSGLRVGTDVEIVFTGIRPGEKLYEELFVEDEHHTRTRHEKIFVCHSGNNHNGNNAPSLSGQTPEAAPAPPGALQAVSESVAPLLAAAEADDMMEVWRLLRVLVPEYGART